MFGGIDIYTEKIILFRILEIWFQTATTLLEEDSAVTFDPL